MGTNAFPLDNVLRSLKECDVFDLDLPIRIREAAYKSWDGTPWDGKPAPDTYGRKPTFKNIHTLTPEEVESLKGKK